MRITIDLDKEKAVLAPGVTNELTQIKIKRATLAVLEVQFSRGLIIQELPVDATGKFELKLPGLYDSEPLTGAASWVKVGTGTSTYYLFAFALINDDLDPLFGVDPDPVTFVADAGANTLTAAGHGLAVGNIVRLSSTVTLPAPFLADTDYFVIASGLTSSVFKVSATLGGTAIDITTTGTGTHSFTRRDPDVAQLPLMGEVSWRYDSRDRKTQTLEVIVDNDVNRDADTIPDSPAIVYTRGSIRLTTEDPPDDSVGIDGDIFINSDTWDLYERQSGAYVLIGNIKGATGSAGIPITNKSVNHLTTLADANTGIRHPTADNNARTFTIDSNANVPYPIGTMLTFINAINVLTIAIAGGDTLTLDGLGTTGSRTLAAKNKATALKVAATEWTICGTSGLT